MNSQEASIGKKLAILAKLKGFTQEQIAKACSMSRISVNRFFRSHTEIRAGDLSSLLETLGINLEGLIDRAIERQMNGSHSSATTSDGPNLNLNPNDHPDLKQTLQIIEELKLRATERLASGT